MTSAASVPTVTLNDDNAIPVVGLGVGELSDSDTEQAVLSALATGYRLIDTAAVYGNEVAVGRAIAASGVPRADIVVTTKVATEDQGYQSVQEALKVSLDKLGLDYVDLYLIHWPAAQQGRYVDTYGGMIRSQADGFIRSIGVCNFSAEHVSTVTDLTFVTPAVNQIELHPLLNQADLRRSNTESGVRTQAYGPLGSPAGVGALTANPVVAAAADAHGKSPAQVLIRWSVQLGNVVIPRSSNPERIAANIDVFDFALTDDEMAALGDLDEGTRYRPDPSDYTGS